MDLKFNSHRISKIYIYFSAHVLTEDTVSREIRDGKLYSRRLLTKTNRVPKWGERLITTRTVKIIEESFVDPKEKVLVTYTRNIGLSRVMVINFFLITFVCDKFFSAITNLFIFFSRVSSRKSPTKYVKRTTDGQKPTAQHGLTLRCLV